LTGLFRDTKKARWRKKSVGGIALNKPEAVIAALENAPSIIVPLVREVPSEVLKRRPQPGKWSAHEHACHLAEVHQLFFSRMERMLSEERPVLTLYNPDEAMEEGALLKVDLDDALERYSRDRARLVEELKDLREEEWLREAEHEEYASYSVLIMFRHVALHDMLHAYRIEELLLKKDWARIES
jgi:hypothetical protein